MSWFLEIMLHLFIGLKHIWALIFIWRTCIFLSFFGALRLSEIWLVSIFVNESMHWRLFQKLHPLNLIISLLRLLGSFMLIPTGIVRWSENWFIWRLLDITYIVYILASLYNLLARSIGKWLFGLFVFLKALLVKAFFFDRF